MMPTADHFQNLIQKAIQKALLVDCPRFIEKIKPACVEIIEKRLTVLLHRSTSKYREALLKNRTYLIPLVAQFTYREQNLH